MSKRGVADVNRIRIRFLIVAFVLIAVEFIIGIFVHDRFIRPFGGDIIVVIILYALIRCVFVRSTQPIAAYVFIFAFAYEFTQKIPLVDLLGISNGFMRALMGTSFSWIDILCYLAGCSLCIGHDIFLERRKEDTQMEAARDIQARIIVKKQEYNLLVMLVGENGELYKPPVPEPESEELVVKTGDKVNAFEVGAVTENYIELKSGIEFTEVKDSSPKTHFLVGKGDSVDLSMYGVCDAVHKISISYIDTVDTDGGKSRMEGRDEGIVVTRNDWEISDMPEKNTEFVIEHKFSDQEISYLKKGHMPEEMEDKWFWYYEDGKVYFHRSWTGICVYIVELNLMGSKHTVTVNRDENQYSNTDIDEDIENVERLMGIYRKL